MYTEDIVKIALYIIWIFSVLQQFKDMDKIWKKEKIYANYFLYFPNLKEDWNNFSAYK